MPTKLDEKTSIPLAWGISAAVFIASGVFTTAYWVKGVNDRLLIIEQKLSIKSVETALIKTVEAKER